MKLRILDVKTETRAPTSFDAQTSLIQPNFPLKRVPVLSVYGVTEAGQKICAHLHQLYPYIYIPYHSRPEPDIVGEFAQRLALSINEALGVAYNRTNDLEKQQYVMAVVPVKAIPYYGYYKDYRLFLKIYLLDPTCVTRLADLLLNGAVMGRSFQPYESHIPFMLQVFIDYNLYGMNWLDLREYRFRRDIRERVRNLNWLPPNGTELFTSESVSEKYEWTNYPRLTKCEVEVDAFPWHIMNRHAIKERRSDPFEPRLDRQEKLVHSVGLLWEMEKKLAGELSTEQQAGSADARLPPSQPDFERRVKEVIQAMDTGRDHQYESGKELDGVMTAFESITALYPDGILPHESITSQTSVNTDESFAIPSTPSIFGRLFSTQQSQFYAPRQVDRDFQPVIDEALIMTQMMLQQDDIVEASSESDSDGIDDDEEMVDILEHMAQVHEEDELDDLPIRQIPQLDGEGDNLSQPPKNKTLELLRRRLAKSSKTSRHSPRQQHQLEFSNRTPGLPSSNSQPNDALPEIYRMWSPIKANSRALFASPPVPLSPSAAKRAETSVSPLSHEKIEDLDVMIIDSSQVAEVKPTVILESMAPSRSDILKFLKDSTNVYYRDPYYGNEEDIPKKPKIFAGREIVVRGNRKEDFQFGASENVHISQEDAFMFSQASGIILDPRSTHSLRQDVDYWFPADLPPTRNQILHNLKTAPLASTTETVEKVTDLSQIDGPTLKDGNDFKFSAGTPESTSEAENERLTLFVMELHSNTPNEKLPDPAKCPIEAIFYSIYEQEAVMSLSRSITRPGCTTGVMMVGDKDHARKFGLRHLTIEYYCDEKQLLWAFLRKVNDYDPDFLLGYEIHFNSWGYLIERAAKLLQVNFCAHLSRRVYRQKSAAQEEEESASHPLNRENDTWGYKKTSVLDIEGRIVLNVWRLMRSELNLTSYAFHNVEYHVLHERSPCFSAQKLSQYYLGSNGLFRWRVLKYYTHRCERILDLLDAINFIGRTSEFAKVFGVEFFSVISRGSQYKVESMMHRIAKPENFVMISPGKQQIRQMRATECLPLVMEPESGFYKSPLVVLDFQSLYPSIMIAYNYCYTTCVGKFSPNRLSTLGFMDYEADGELLKTHIDDLNSTLILGFVSPNGVAFLRQNVREGVLRKMLSEILDTRVMVKGAMKRHKESKSLQRILDARQLGLKFIANVTYGYTSASFSGRMPCVDIADSIVQTGRETLERAIKTINNHPTWNARVVYGDTDSLFIYFAGSSRERAFRVGKDIADVITKQNPAPMKLKFEKVYHPCVLLSKKRYVGFKYESVDQQKPDFEAKGIETVRRDGCPAVSKIMEASLKILFRSQDLSELKQYLLNQFYKIMGERVSIRDFIIAKAVRLGTYSENCIPPPGAYISMKKLKADPRTEPQYGERVPYIICYEGPKARLVDCAKCPDDFIRDQGTRLHGEYYITKQIIPALSRVFDLCGVDIFSWYREMPRVHRAIRHESSSGAPTKKGHKLTIEHYYKLQHCFRCSKPSRDRICFDCAKNTRETVAGLMYKFREAEVHYQSLVDVCRDCVHGDCLEVVESCMAIDCPILYERTKARRNVNWLKQTEEICSQIL